MKKYYCKYQSLSKKKKKIVQNITKTVRLSISDEYIDKISGALKLLYWKRSILIHICIVRGLYIMKIIKLVIEIGEFMA